MAAGTGGLTLTGTRIGTAGNAIQVIRCHGYAEGCGRHDHGADSTAIHVGIGSFVTATGSLSAETGGAGAHGIDVGGAGAVGNFTTTGSITTQGAAAHGLRVDGGGVLTVNGATVSTHGASAFAIAARGATASVTSASLSSNASGALLTAGGNVSLSQTRLESATHGVMVLTATPLFGSTFADVNDLLDGSQAPVAAPCCLTQDRRSTRSLWIAQRSLLAAMPSGWKGRTPTSRSGMQPQ